MKFFLESTWTYINKNLLKPQTELSNLIASGGIHMGHLIEFYVSKVQKLLTQWNEKELQKNK